MCIRDREGTFWQDSLDRYHRFLRHWIMDQSDKKVLLLELGVGEMTPSIIKLPFWELTAKNEDVYKRQTVSLAAAQLLKTITRILAASVFTVIVALKLQLKKALL